MLRCKAEEYTEWLVAFIIFPNFLNILLLRTYHPELCYVLGPRETKLANSQSLDSPEGTHTG